MPRVDPGGPLGRALAERREAINARVRVCRLAHPRLSGEAVLEFLATLGPVADAVSGVDPAATAEVVERLAAVALPLVARDLLGPGARTPLVQLAWGSLLPRWPALLVTDGERLARATSNALATLGRQTGTRPGEWIEAMKGLGERARSATELLEAGKVAAWRAGLPQMRRSARAGAATLRPELAGRALGAGEVESAAARDALVERLSADPWAGEGGAGIRLVASAGGFRGLGGPFLAPPRVFLTDGGLVATDGRASFTVHADRFGVAFLRTGGEVPELPASRKRVRVDVLAPEGTSIGLSADGSVEWDGVAARLPELSNASGAACDGTTLAVTHALSHALRLVAGPQDWRIPLKTPALALAVFLALADAVVAQEPAPTLETPRGARIPYLVDLPASPGKAPALVLAPGQGYHMRRPLLERVAGEAARAGFVAVRFDWAYLAAKGSPSEDLSAELEDLGAVLAWARADARIDPARIYLAGKSLGSIVAYRRFQADPALRALLLLTPVFPDLDTAREAYPDLPALGRPAVVVVGDADRLCPAARLHEVLGATAIPVVGVAGDHGLNSGPADDPAWSTRNAANVDAAAAMVAYWLRVLELR